MNAKKDNYTHPYLMIINANLRPGVLHCHEREGARQRQRLDKRIGENEITVEEVRQFMLGEESGSLRYTVPRLRPSTSSNEDSMDVKT
jgi:hypothetical protein